MSSPPDNGTGATAVGDGTAAVEAAAYQQRGALRIHKQVFPSQHLWRHIGADGGRGTTEDVAVIYGHYGKRMGVSLKGQKPVLSAQV